MFLMIEKSDICHNLRKISADGEKQRKKGRGK
jgi:hypothetical protein